MKSIVFLTLLMTFAANAESPFRMLSPRRLVYKDGARILDKPASDAARLRATEDLLGIRHYAFILEPERAGAKPYQLKLVQYGEAGEEKVLQQVEIKGVEQPQGGVGVSILPSSEFVRVKVYFASDEAMHEVPAKKLGKIEPGKGEDPFLLRYVVDDKPLWTLLWSEGEK